MHIMLSLSNRNFFSVFYFLSLLQTTYKSISYFLLSLLCVFICTFLSISSYWPNVKILYSWILTIGYKVKMDVFNHPNENKSRFKPLWAFIHVFFSKYYENLLLYLAWLFYLCSFEIAAFNFKQLDGNLKLHNLLLFDSGILEFNSYEYFCSKFNLFNFLRWKIDNELHLRCKMCHFGSFGRMQSSLKQ